jgi:hypothetical protein
MLALARDIIGSQPILALFLAIGLGYLVGQLSIGGFSLGVGAVLFVGLAVAMPNAIVRRMSRSWEPIANVPPAEAEAAYYRELEELTPIAA